MKTKDDTLPETRRRMSTRSGEANSVKIAKVEKAEKPVSKTSERKPSPKDAKVKPEAVVKFEHLDRRIFQLEEEEAISRDSKRDVELFNETCRNIENSVTRINELKKEGRSLEDDEVLDKRADAVILIANLKKLNRLTQMRGKSAIEKTQQAKSKVDGLHLELQNLLYEVMHMKKEIQKCLNFSSKDEDIDLVDVDTFYTEAPVAISKPDVTKTDPHQQMLARLDWEMNKRKELSVQKEKLLEEKKMIEYEITQKTDYLTSLKPRLSQIIKSTEPVQDFMGMPLEGERLMFEAAQYLPRPLYVLYIQAKAYQEACDKHMSVDIDGDIVQAKNDFYSDNVLLDDSDDSDVENNDIVETNGERRRIVGKLERKKQRLAEKQKHLLSMSRLTVRIKLSKKSEYDLELVFGYLTNLHVCSVKINLKLRDLTNYSTSLLSNDVILRDLLFPDPGIDSPNFANKYQLERAGLSTFSDYVSEMGHPYLWCQLVCGLNCLPTMELDSYTPDLLLSTRHFQPVVKAIRDRLQARMSLHKQLQELASLQLFDIPNTLMLPTKVVCALTGWKEVTVENFMSNERGRQLVDSNLVSTECLFYSATFARDEVFLIVDVVIHADYPQQPPLLLLSLQSHTVNSHTSLKCLESEVNAFTEEIFLTASSKHLLLTAMLRKLQVCFDIYVETGFQYLTKDKLYTRKVRGRDRNRPYKYHKDGFFTHR